MHLQKKASHKMRNIWIIAKKEFTSFFHSPIAYVIGIVVFLVMGIYFTYDLNLAILYEYTPDFTYILDILVFPLIFLVVPILTMRTITDENRTGTLELLLTAPVKDHELIIGKWLGTWLFFLSIIVLTWVYPIAQNFLVDPGIDLAKIAANYIGVALMASALTAVGVAVSSLFKNTIASLVASLGVVLLLWLASAPSQFLDGTAAAVFENLSVTQHYYNGFRAGVIDLLDVSYYISLTVLALFLGTRSIESKRWR
jgi:ABC-2 type transport system permease protein